MFALMVDCAIAADGEEPGLQMLSPLERRPYRTPVLTSRRRTLLQAHQPDERLLDDVARPIQVVEDAARIPHERPLVSLEQRVDVKVLGRHRVSRRRRTGDG